MTSPSPFTQLKALAATATLGTARGGSSMSPDVLLTRAAVLGTQSRAGFRSRMIAGQTTACPSEGMKIASEAATATLERLLRDPDAGLIAEWADLAYAKGLRVQDRLAPVLLDWWSRQSKRPEVIFAVLGQRGPWLTSLNPAWQRPVVGDQIPPNADDLWQNGKTPERVGLLHAIRRIDPARALTLVQSTWEIDGADERRRFVEVCEQRASMADEQFLESALDDKSKTVRRAAASALSRIPQSRLRSRMYECAKKMIVVDRRRGLLKQSSKVRLSPPVEFDKSWERDGIEEHAANGRGQRAWWMLQVLSQADLSVWTDLIGVKPEAALNAIADDDYFESALDAITAAAATRGDAVWCAAILRHRLSAKKFETQDIQKLLANLTTEQRDPLLLEAARHRRFPGAEKWAILASSECRWSSEFSVSALEVLCGMSLRANDAWNLYESVDRVARRIAPDLAERFVEAVAALFSDELTESFRKSIDRVRLRADMHKEFAS